MQMLWLRKAEWSRDQSTFQPVLPAL